MSKTKSFLYRVTWLLSAGTGCALIILTGVHLYLSPSLPSVETLRDIRLQVPLRIYSNDGKLIGEIGEKRRTPIKYDDIPQTYIDALLSAEDAQFYSHGGVSIKGLMRAMSQILISGDIQGGGSTITMQVARNFFLSKRQEFRRKFNEILLALRIERELSKQEILELYVNVIFLGNRAYGIQAAAQTYYGKPLDQLSTAQLAMIAGMPKAPSTANPIANPVRAVQRRDWILGRMYSLDKIDEATLNLALAEPVNARYHGNSLDLNASYIAEMARQKAVELFGADAYTDGYRIYTTIDSNLQTYAQEAVIQGVLAYNQRHGYRGPEQTLPVPAPVLEHLSQVQADNELGEPQQIDPVTPTLINAPDDAQDSDSAIDHAYESWFVELQSDLKGLPTYGGLRAAAVTRVHEKSFSAILADGTPLQVQWDHGLAAARPYLSVNSMGPRPESAADVVSHGDVVRVRKESDGHWHLHQIPTVQGSLVSLAPRNGAILALTGGFDFQQSNFNRVIQARRQPGSSFKPFIYTSALENGFTAASIINDAPIVFEDTQLEGTWRPENAGGRFYGPTRLREALYRSRNLASIRLLRSVGINNALTTIGRFGFDTQHMSRDLSLALGSYAVTSLELTAGFATFANGGHRIEPYFIDRILDFEGKAVFESLPLTVCAQCEVDEQTKEHHTWSNEPFLFEGDAFDISREIKSLLGTLEPQDFPRAPRVVDEQVAYIMDSILKDVVTQGTGTRARALNRSDVAGKTGTTNSATDVWFTGYGGDVVTTAWIGFDEATPLGSREYGGTTALPMWIDYNHKALKNRPEVNKPRPQGLVTVRINPETGKRARAGDPNAAFEIFRSEDVPPIDDGNTDAPSPWNEAEATDTDQIF